jgi:DnaJ like chaperone protein
MKKETIKKLYLAKFLKDIFYILSERLIVRFIKLRYFSTVLIIKLEIYCMGWLGKVVGGSIGFAIGGPIGAVAGAAFGHTFDTRDPELQNGSKNILDEDEQAQLTFFVAAFSMLAKLTKVDGTVSDEEINSIEKIMIKDLRLKSESRKIAVNVFKTALESTESFESFANQFYNQFKFDAQMLELMIDILLRISISDGTLNVSEEHLILSAVKSFNISDKEYRLIKSKYIKDVDKYHAVLGCDGNDTDDFVKSQYRRLVSEYHPDKITSKGLPEEFTEFATEKFREIQEAYEFVKKKRGFS